MNHRIGLILMFGAFALGALLIFTLRERQPRPGVIFLSGPQPAPIEAQPSVSSLRYAEPRLALVPPTLAGRYCIVSSRPLPHGIGQQAFGVDYADPTGQSPPVHLMLTESDEPLDAGPTAVAIRVLNHRGLADTSSRPDQVWVGWKSSSSLFMIWLRTGTADDRRMAQRIYRRVAEDIARAADPLITGHVPPGEHGRRIAALREAASHCPLVAAGVGGP